ncbi:hypothetical protein [Geobacter benzoatilyticus]|uniref:Uncharacterized protein n=1 Tax=Geobacter benzoatilyticus TaxID=2815309 RepID=A0ABX7PZN5_9BACT|nr:hypothetical protein [Geobacter benzoatilyticus]QSV44417.1 hypothetical protein JZM60_09530 [Geobacter benzoatilyticus]
MSKGAKTMSTEKHPNELHYLKAIRQACPLETWQEIMAKTVEQAKAGDADARLFLAFFLVGRPTRPSTPLSGIASAEDGIKLNEMLFGQA